MASENKAVHRRFYVGVMIGGALGVLFVGLKLTGHIDWSWWWVTAPFWIPPALILILVVVYLLTVLVGIFCDEMIARRQRGKK